MFPKKKRDIASATYTFEKQNAHAISNKKRDTLLCKQAGILAPPTKNATPLLREEVASRKIWEQKAIMPFLPNQPW